MMDQRPTVDTRVADALVRPLIALTSGMCLVVAATIVVLLVA